MDFLSLELDEMEYFQMAMRKALRELFLNKNIESASSYFKIWQELREILDNELGARVNQNLHNELEETKNIYLNKS